MPRVERLIGSVVTAIRSGLTIVGGMAAILVAANALAAEPLCPVTTVMHLDLPITRAALAHDKAITIVALGSSSTEGSGASAPDHTYPARLAALLHATWPDVPVSVLNKGVGGQTVDAVLTRLDADVVAVKPDLVIWQVGTNEAMRGMDPGQFETLLDAGLRRLTTIGSDVVLMDYQLAPRMPPEAIRSVYRDIIVKEAKAHGVSLFSRAELMQLWQAAEPTANDMIGPDGLHHSDRGYACLAASLDSAIVAATVPRIVAAKANSK
jgi:acyl-CoA thioesterase I